MTDRNEIEKIVIKNTAIICKKLPESLSMDTRFGEDLKFRSMQAVKLTMLLEDAVDIKLPMARVLKNKTLKDAVDLVVELLADAGR
ncbi:MAG: acyl carrier protein [Lysobacterales bacterium]|nr:MAG: acyl carrier protein [Xanthomonadales bacterium]